MGNGAETGEGVSTLILLYLFLSLRLSVRLSARQGSKRLEASGIFKGAEVKMAANWQSPDENGEHHGRRKIGGLQDCRGWGGEGGTIMA